jgi:acyl carrier protein
MDITSEIRQFVINEFAVGIEPEELRPDYDLMDNGILDSLGVLTVLAWIEDLLGVEIDAETIDAKNFRTVESIGSLIEGLQHTDRVASAR